MDNHHSTNKASPESISAADPGIASHDQALRKISSTELFHGAREVLIQHEEKTYRLQVTRNGKLILVK